MFNISLKMIKLDRKMSDLWQFVCKNIILTLVQFLFYFVYCLLMHTKMNDIKNVITNSCYYIKRNLNS